MKCYWTVSCHHPSGSKHQQELAAVVQLVSSPRHTFHHHDEYSTTVDDHFDTDVHTRIHLSSVSPYDRQTGSNEGSRTLFVSVSADRSIRSSKLISKYATLGQWGNKKFLSDVLLTNFRG